jgi:hypothetical protein
MAEEKRKWTSYRLSGDTLSKFKSRVGDTPNYDSTRLRSQVTEAGVQQMNERKKAEAAAEEEIQKQEEERIAAENKAKAEQDAIDADLTENYGWTGEESDLARAQEEKRIAEVKEGIIDNEQKKADKAAKK